MNPFLLSPKKTLPFLLLFVLLCTLSGCGKDAGSKETPHTLEEFRQQEEKIGIIDGTIFGEVAESTLPNAERILFDNREDAYRALLTGQVDGVVDDEATIRAMMRSTEVFAILDGYLIPSEYGFAFPKNEKGNLYAEQMSALVEKMKASGALSSMDEKWFGDDPTVKISENASSLQALNGTLTIAYSKESVPFSYTSGDQPTGYEIDLALSFCREYGYGLNLVSTTFPEMLIGTAYGKYDAGCGGITITEKRSENHVFSAPDYTGGISVCIRSGVDGSGTETPQNTLARHFRNAFVEDGRYKIFFTGIFMTISITALATVFGIPLGVLLFWLSNRTHVIMRLLTKGFVWVLQGIPAVMMILLLFYTWYRDMYGGGFLCAVISFTLLFGAEWQRVLSRYARAVAEGRLLRDYRTEAIDTGEFFKVLRRKRGNSLRAELSDRVCLLLKASALVGYISVTDMTRAFEKIRTESFETMLPLLLTTVVYFVLIKLICLLFRNKEL